MSDDVVVVIGAGGIGLAIARRQGAGRSVLLAHNSLDAQVWSTFWSSQKIGGLRVSSRLTMSGWPTG